MPKFTLREVIHALDGGWAVYIPRFQALSPQAQAAFLEQQGFSRFRDLLAHVIAWWEEGHRIICGIIDDPSFTWQDIDVDAFNVAAIQRFANMPEDELFDYFERMRRVMLNLVSDLPEDALENEDIANWLLADVIEHLRDHALPEPEKE
jgi:hypothetical protein